MLRRFLVLRRAFSAEAAATAEVKQDQHRVRLSKQFITERDGQQWLENEGKQFDLISPRNWLHESRVRFIFFMLACPYSYFSLIPPILLLFWFPFIFFYTNDSPDAPLTFVPTIAAVSEKPLVRATGPCR